MDKPDVYTGDPEADISGIGRLHGSWRSAHVWTGARLALGRNAYSRRVSKRLPAQKNWSDTS